MSELRLQLFPLVFMTLGILLGIVHGTGQDILLIGILRSIPIGATAIGILGAVGMIRSGDRVIIIRILIMATIITIIQVMLGIATIAIQATDDARLVEIPAVQRFLTDDVLSIPQ